MKPSGQKPTSWPPSTAASGAYPSPGGYPSGPPAGPAGRGAPAGKALPIVVSVGLAVGVFSGLMIVRPPAPAASAEGLAPPPDAALAREARPPVDAGVAEQRPVAVAPADAALPATASLRFAVQPAAAEVAITVDGVPVSERAVVLELGEGGERTVAIAARARGYRAWQDQRVVRADQLVTIELQPVPRPPRREREKPPGPRNGSDGLIDL